MTDEHRIFAVERDQIRDRALRYSGFFEAASHRATFHGALEKFAPNVAVTVRCDISRLRRKSLSVFKPTQLFERVERHVTVRADRYSTVMSQIGTERKQAVTKICFGTRA